jgi:phytoene dehydrogenase-like protein
VHVGGTFEEIAASARAAWKGTPSERPFVIVGQHTLFDPTRAPEGKHTLWAYCHVPNGSDVDMSGRMEAQIERFAPGFRERILARHIMAPRALEAHNENLVGGDILGGLIDLWQTIFRPTLRYYGTPLPGLYLCSSSTPPGPGVHGLCGYFAAQQVLRQVFGAQK